MGVFQIKVGARVRILLPIGSGFLLTGSWQMLTVGVGVERSDVTSCQTDLGASLEDRMRKPQRDCPDFDDTQSQGFRGDFSFL